MKIQISDSFTYGNLLRFTFPSIIMMIFTSIYVVVDGFFVSNFVGKSQFTAVNFIMPFLMILGAIGFMFGTGGSAIVAETMGENKPEKAKEQFSLFVYTSAVCGIIISVLGIILIRPTAVLLGADREILEHCVV
ncbi:MAG: MATE family efflux transporter, partial [Ruminococcus sp.]|nr:MATE family efflux transporter [Ruminococcus sp.]